MRKKGHRENSMGIDWAHEQTAFEKELPRITSTLRASLLRAIPRRDLEEYLQDSLMNAWATWRAAVLRGKDPSRFVGSIAWYALKRTLNGRSAHYQSVRDIQSRFLAHKCRHLALPKVYAQGGSLNRQAISYLAFSPETDPGEAAAFRVDFAEFETSLTDRQKRQCELSLWGERTKRIAEILNLTMSAISAMRRALEEKWEASQR